MIVDAEKKGTIKIGDTLLEVSSGNTGIGLAGVSLLKGYNVKIMLPETASNERVNLLKKLGAEVIFYNTNDGRAKILQYAKELAKANNWKMLNQYENKANVEAHYKTAEEIIKQLTKNNIIPDVLVLGIGTGGTITGISKILKEKFPKIKVIGIHPEDKIEGLRGFDDFKPPIMDSSLIDSIIKVSEGEAKSGMQELITKYGLLVGISSGAAFFVTKEIAQSFEGGKNIITLFPDGLDKYLSYI